MTSKTDGKSIGGVQLMREIRDRMNAEIADMSYEELSQRFQKAVRSDPLFARIPKARKPVRPRIDREATREHEESREREE